MKGIDVVVLVEVMSWHAASSEAAPKIKIVFFM